MHLYAVYIERGRSHSQWSKLFTTLSELNAKPIDYTGSWSICTIKHHIDGDTLHERITYNLKKPNTVRVEEITRDTLDEDHMIFQDIYDRLYAPHDQFQNIL